MKRRVADIIVDALIENGITDCFSVVGGGAMHLNNAFVLRDEIRKTYCHHEQACAMAAEGYAKVSEKVAVVCVTSGPGGLNALNGVQGAYVDNTPMIIISGHPRYATTVASTGLNLRYRGVQEFDIVNTVKTLTKYSKLIRNPYEVRMEVDKAIRIAKTGRRGPVWLDIPLDVQGTLIDESELLMSELVEKSQEDKVIMQEAMKEILQVLTTAKRPSILFGSGIRVTGTIQKFREFVNKLSVPVVGGALQADILSNDEPLYYGMSGNVGSRCGNFILQNADVILVIGNSLSFKQTGFNQTAFAKNAKIYMIDIEEDEAKKPGLRVEKCYPFDLAEFFDAAMEVVHEIPAKKSWQEYCDNIRKRFSRFEALDYIDNAMEGISACDFWKNLLELAEGDAVFALGNSSCIVPPLVFGINKKNQQIIVNYNSGSMGDDIPEAIGIAKAVDTPVYCVTGDGSVMMNLQELQTMKYHKLPIRLVIFSNHGYGAIRRTCQNFFNGTYTGCDEESGISMPNFEKVANAFDLPYRKCGRRDEMVEAIKWLMEQKENCLLEIEQKVDDVMYPRLMSKMNADGVFVDPELQDMYPFISEEEMCKLMLD